MTDTPPNHCSCSEEIVLARVKGHCRDCLFRVQEWSLKWKKHQGAIQEYMELDQYCQVHDNFVPDDGYCHWWEAK